MFKFILNLIKDKYNAEVLVKLNSIYYDSFSSGEKVALNDENSILYNLIILLMIISQSSYYQSLYEWLYNWKLIPQRLNYLNHGIAQGRSKSPILSTLLLSKDLLI